MSGADLQQRLLAIFAEELEEHQTTLGRDLLSLERCQDAAEQQPLLESMFRAAHSLKGAARSVQMAAIERICHSLEQALQDQQRTSALVPAPALRSLFEQFDLLREEARKLTPSSPRADPRPMPEVREREPSEASKRALRVSTERADLLFNLASDLVTWIGSLEQRVADFDALRADLSALRAATSPAEASAALRRLARGIEHGEESLRRGVASVLRAGERLEDETQRLRLVPFEEACDGLSRAARDLGLSLDRPFDLSIEAEGVEIERDVAQRLRAPLLHLLRNAVTHGIETATERKAQGKPARARVRIEATLHGKLMQVEVSDDGRGFDLAQIRQAATRLSLDPGVGERELLAYTMLPGFSTAGSVTELSGRGVGLDAVKRSVEALHGSVEIKSTPGAGACFVLRVPLTLSKLRCLLVRAGERWFALSANYVARVSAFVPEHVVWVDGRLSYRTDAGLLSLASLSHVLGLDPARSPLHDSAAVLVLTGDERDLALAVDELGREREITSRALPARLRGTGPVSAVTFLPQGQLGLVLHPQELCRRAREQPMPESARRMREAKPRQRILVVEDSATTRAVLKSALEEAGYAVHVAQDGEEATGLLRQHAFDLLLSDVQMPHKDGFTLTEEVRADPQLSRLPVVLMTSLDSESDRLRGYHVGANAYLTKSAFDHTALLATLSSLL